MQKLVPFINLTARRLLVELTTTGIAWKASPRVAMLISEREFKEALELIELAGGNQIIEHVNPALYQAINTQDFDALAGIIAALSKPSAEQMLDALKNIQTEEN